MDIYSQHSLLWVQHQPGAHIAGLLITLSWHQAGCPPPNLCMCRWCSVRGPRAGGRDRAPEPYGLEAREFLRKKLIGKEVTVKMEYTRKIGFQPGQEQAAPTPGQEVGGKLWIGGKRSKLLLLRSHERGHMAPLLVACSGCIDVQQLLLVCNLSQNADGSGCLRY